MRGLILLFAFLAAFASHATGRELLQIPDSQDDSDLFPGVTPIDTKACRDMSVVIDGPCKGEARPNCTAGALAMDNLITIFNEWLHPDVEISGLADLEDGKLEEDGSLGIDLDRVCNKRLIRGVAENATTFPGDFMKSVVANLTEMCTLRLVTSCNSSIAADAFAAAVSRRIIYVANAAGLGKAGSGEWCPDDIRALSGVIALAVEEIWSDNCIDRLASLRFGHSVFLDKVPFLQPAVESALLNSVAAVCNDTSTFESSLCYRDPDADPVEADQDETTDKFCCNSG